MKKTKKTLLYIIIAALILIITTGAIILFGVVGVDKKVTYSESKKANNKIIKVMMFPVMTFFCFHTLKVLYC